MRIIPKYGTLGVRAIDPDQFLSVQRAACDRGGVRRLDGISLREFKCRSMQIRKATPHDAPAILEILMPTIRAGETYALDSAMSEPEAIAYWMGPDRETFVAQEGGAVVGTYYLRANQAGGGRHVCNCGYMTHASATGRGVARAMCEHSLQTAAALGYRAMQFNFVVSTNQRAVRLWKSMGFSVVGQLPQAFEHPSLGFVDALVMHRWVPA